MAVRLLSCLVLLMAMGPIGGHTEYTIGVGIADVTGPVAGITLMGYGNLEQQGSGIHLRQWSRAFLIERDGSHFVFVTVDCAMMSDGVRIQVVEQLSTKYPGVFDMDNVMISATHTHSGVGGYLMHTLFDLPSYGFSHQSFGAMVSGIVKSVDMAYRRMQKGTISVKKGKVIGANINRSPTSYLANPESERAQYKDNVDKELTQVQFLAASGEPLGAIHWFAVHATSMNNTNTLVSSDNMGYASILFERKMNGNNLLGKGPFVAAFASSNLGDVSPNVMGPICHPSGDVCNSNSSCKSRYDSCFALGPGQDMFESTRIIAETIFNVAWDLWSEGAGKEISGKVGSVHQYVDMPTASVEITDPLTNLTKKGYGCLPAMGYSFAAGTIDGPFATHIVQQGTNKSMYFIDAVRNVLLAKPTQSDHDCHAPKPILLFTGGMTYPFDWQPRVVSTQVAQVGELVLACVPGEFTTMAGRRIRNAMQEVAGPDSVPVLVGLCNTYSDYITTFEEYQMQRFEAAANLYGPHTLAIHLAQFKKLMNAILLVQRYEGASTLYGPHTLSIHLQQLKKLALAVRDKEDIERGPEPFDMRSPKLSFVSPVVLDWAGWHREFGDVLQQPTRMAQTGDRVSVVFVSGHPRNEMRLDDTYCTVELQTFPGIWKVVYTDADWETRFHWKRSWSVIGTSTVTVEFDVTDLTEPGIYRIRHFGHHKTFSGDIYPYSGTTLKFFVLNSSNGQCETLKWNQAFNLW